MVSQAAAQHDGHPLRPEAPGTGPLSHGIHSNWQWYDLIQASRTIILDDLPAQFSPIVQVVDNFARNHKLGNLFEAHVGKGRLLVCTIDLPRMADKQPAARQLLTSLYAYAGWENFSRLSNSTRRHWTDYSYRP